MRIRFYLSLLVAFLIILINYYAGLYNVYWLFRWFDIPMHVSGGFMVGLFAQTGLDYFVHFKKRDKKSDEGLYGSDLVIHKRRFLVIFLFVLVVGIIWEFAEWYFGVTDGLGSISRLDTIKDVIDDIIGGALSIWFWKFLFNKTKN